MLHLVRGSTFKRSFIEQELICCDPKAPPVNLPRVSLSSNYLGRHICHTTRHTRMHSLVRIVDSNVEVGKMCMPL